METEVNKENTVIVGAGTAGMTAALALAAHNIPSQIYEKSDVLQEVGAGIQLSSNACRLLYRLGLKDALDPYVSEPDFIYLKYADNGNTILSLPIREISVPRWHAPYLTIHRADLQTVLKQQVDKNPLISYRGGCSINEISGSAQTGFTVDIAQRETRAAAGNREEHSDIGESTVSSAGSQKINARHVICCDGVWSQTRAESGEKARFSSYIAWRATLKREELPPQFATVGALNAVSAYMSKDSHFIIYPLRKGALYNFVVITKGKNIGETWSHRGDTAELLRLFNGSHSLLREIIEAVPSWTYWPLFQMPFPRFLGKDGRVFLGDASHAIIPFAAQGAAMAIEDACSLAAAVALGRSTMSPMNYAESFAYFNAVRRQRVISVAKRSIFNGFVYHLSGMMATARNCVMRLRPHKCFISDLDWLYSYDAGAAFVPPLLHKKT